MRIYLDGEWDFFMGENKYGKNQVNNLHPIQDSDTVLLEKATKVIKVKEQDKEKEKKESSSDILSPVIFYDTILLPSTTEINKKGEKKIDKSKLICLSRKRGFLGKCYYKKQVVIPEDWEGKAVELYLERTKFTKIYWDKELVSNSYETLIPQRHKLTKEVEPGIHELVIVVDNDLAAYDNFPKSLYNGHQYTEHTQTNWNGILGQIFLYTREEAYILSADVITEKNTLGVLFKVIINSHSLFKNAVVEISLDDIKRQYTRELKEGENEVIETLRLEELKYWDEFLTYRYKVSISVYHEQNLIAESSFYTGFSKCSIRERELFLNNRRISLRGNIDCAIYPLTGATPMKEEEWEEIFKLLKEYGMNHCRFHSWVPPEGAFEAADRLGMYLQIELPCFGNRLVNEEKEDCQPVLKDYLYDQGAKILREYGNHPSFLIFAIGNEMDGDMEEFDKLLSYLKGIRNDKIYTQGSNNFVDNPSCSQESDCWITMRTAKEVNIRASFSHGDKPLGYIQGKERLGTVINYEAGAKLSKVPVIAHETGQYEIYPDVNERYEYTGITYSTALEACYNDLEEKGLIEYSKEFLNASGKLALKCYKEDIESILRTDAMSGFQLLSLQDFPGQGTALIGILNSFYKSKGLIYPLDWREFCNDTVLLGEFPFYTWLSGDILPLNIKLYHYGREKVWREPIYVTLKEKDEILFQSVIREVLVATGQVKNVGGIDIRLPKREKPGALELLLESGNIRNHYPIWIYPQEEVLPHKDVYITDIMDKRAEEFLEEGKTVLLCSSNLTGSCEVMFTPDFWNYPMFKSICESRGLKPAPGTMGLLIDAKHPALKEFPTDTFSDWQWQQIVIHSNPLIIKEDLEQKLIVRVIDNFSRNQSMGLLFEKKVGMGHLILCTADILSNRHIPEIKQLYNSLTSYVNSLNKKDHP